MSSENENPVNDENVFHPQVSIGDPEQPASDASEAIRVEYRNQLAYYSNDMLELCAQSHLIGEGFWLDFQTTFREHSIHNLDDVHLKRWLDLLDSRGIYVERKRHYPKLQALLDIWRREEHLSNSDELPKAEPLPVGASQVPHRTREVKSEPQIHGDASAQSPSTHAEPTSAQDAQRDNEPAAAITSMAEGPISQTRGYSNVERSDTSQKSTGIGSFMRAYQGRKQFSGAFYEDLISGLELFEILAKMCKLTASEKCEAFPIMLKDDALSFYMDSSKPEDSYEVIVERFKEHYLTPEQQNRTLVLWQSMRLSKDMRESPEKSELEVFRCLVTKLSKTQRQLSKIYRRDEFLRDQIVIAADHGKIQQSLRERVPRTSADAQNRIATFLSSEPKSASAFVCSDDEHSVMYTTGYRYGGKARKPIRGNSNNSRAIGRWLAGHKGCFVCKKKHRAREHHSRAEVSAAIEKLKKSYPSAMVAMDDFAMIVSDLASGFDEGEEIDEDKDIVIDDSDDPDLVNFAQVKQELDKSAEIYLANVAFLHGRSFVTDMKAEIMAMNAELSHGEQRVFKGLFIDTCANRSSVMSLAQYKAYCSEFGVPVEVDQSCRRNLKGIGGMSSALGTASIPVPFHRLGIVVTVKFQIVSDNVPTLLCMKDMLDAGLDISIRKQELYFQDRVQPLKFENYFLIHSWSPQDVNYCMYTEHELRKLHRAFGHPSATALVNVLRRARPGEMTKEVKCQIAEIVRECSICAKHSPKPRRFKLTVGSEGLMYNHIVAVDIMYISGKPVVHLVDEATHFSAARFVSSVSTETVWKAILECWSRVYLGPPDFLRIDQGSQFISREFLECAEAEGITVLKAPIESPTSMSHVERYHGPLRTAYLKIRDDLSLLESDNNCLQMAVKAVNDTIGPEGLCPTLLVFGAIPRPARNTPSPVQIERSQAIEKAMKLVEKEQAKRKVAFGLGGRNRAQEQAASKRLLSLPTGSKVRVYRKDSKVWEGPYPLLHVENETAVVQMPSGRKIFRTSVVKPSESMNTRNQQRTGEREKLQGDISGLLFSKNDLRRRSPWIIGSENDFEDDSAFITTVTKKSNDNTFEKSRAKELKGLIERGTFEIVDAKTVSEGTRIYGTRWVDAIKTVDGKSFEKSRLVAQNYNDAGASGILTKSPTVTRMGVRLAVSIAACMQNKSSYLRDISQAYVQSETKIERSIFLRPPSEMKLTAGKLLKAIRPLYGIPESGLHWYLTYVKHHKDELGMNQTKFDPCVLYRRNDEELEGLTVLQVDDSFGFGTERFLQDEDDKSKRFITKPRIDFAVGSKRDFNGLVVEQHKNGCYRLQQTEKLSSLDNPCSENDFVSTRAKIQYVACCTRPDLATATQLLASSVKDKSPDRMKSLKKIVDRCKKTSTIGLNYVPLDLTTVKLVLFTDASFANAPGLKSQIGFVIAMIDGTEKANIVHFGSSRCKRVTRSVMAAEIHALIYGFDNAVVVKSMVQEILGKEIDIDAIVDSRTLFNVIAKNSSTMEKRLQIDVCAIRESHTNGELRNLAWTPGINNPADGLTRGMVSDSHPLWKLMTTNHIKIVKEGWIQTNQDSASSTVNVKEKNLDCRLSDTSTLTRA